MRLFLFVTLSLVVVAWIATQIPRSIGTTSRFGMGLFAVVAVALVAFFTLRP
jgi:hypothetical protein